MHAGSLESTIDYFTVVCSVTWPLFGSEARVDLGCLPFTETIRLEISGKNIKQVNATLREKESL